MQDDFEMTRGKEIVLGLFFILGGLFAFLYNWYDLITEGAFRHGGAILAPLLFVGGVMVIAAPYPYDDQPFKTERAPKSWNVFIAVGVILGFANWYFMNFG